MKGVCRLARTDDRPGVRPSRAIKRNYLHDTAALQLREMIAKGDIKPGDWLNEGELALNFGISRTPMREAIKMLAAEEMLEIVPNHGPRVKLIEKSELKDMLEIIAVLEATAGEQACALITDAEIEELQAVHDDMIRSWDTENHEGYFSRNRRIHNEIVRISGNITLQRLYHSLSGRIQVARYSSNKTIEQWRKAVGEHEGMLRLLRERDGNALFDLMREHVRSQNEVITAAYGAGSAS